MAGFGTGFGSLNKVTFIGRLTKDPRIGTTASQVRVANFGFAVTNRKKNPSTGQWDDVPMFLDVAVFNRGDSGKQVEFVERFLHKGDLAYIEGRLEAPREWTGQDGVKHISMNVTADEVQFLAAPKEGGRSSEGFARKPMGSPPPPMDSGMGGADSYEQYPPEPAFQPPATNRPDEEIPF
jgi:single-strand DNA-binding protein